jgi:hypothetical protein
VQPGDRYSAKKHASKNQQIHGAFQRQQIAFRYAYQKESLV